jgi:hypothetical protein
VWVLSGPTIFGKTIVADADENEMTCTKEELILATEGQIILNYDKFSQSERLTVSGKVFHKESFKFSSISFKYFLFYLFF